MHIKQRPRREQRYPDRQREHLCCLASPPRAPAAQQKQTRGNCIEQPTLSEEHGQSDVFPSLIELVVADCECKMSSMQKHAKAVPQIAEEGEAGGAAAEKKSRERE